MSDIRIFERFNGAAVVTKTEAPQAKMRFENHSEKIRAAMEKVLNAPVTRVDVENCPAMQEIFALAAERGLEVRPMLPEDYKIVESWKLSTTPDRLYVDVAPDAKGVFRIARSYIG